MTKPIVLASSSPRRQELLHFLDLPFLIDPSTIDETAVVAAAPPLLAETLARTKALDVAQRHRAAIVIGADTLVEYQGQVLNKPVDTADAERMLALLTGNTHMVHTGVAVWSAGRYVTRVVSAAVTMRTQTAAQIATYVATGEPMDKAGAYAAQGFGSALIDHVEGSFLAVVGLPLLALRDLLAAQGVPVHVAQDRLEALERGLRP